MLRSLFLLLLIGACLAKVNYRTTTKIVSEEEKERILANDNDDAAFAAFLNVYDDIEPDGFRGSSTPDEIAAERRRQKKIFVRNIQLIREHNKRYARGEVSYRMVVNSFAVMDEDNRRMFLGLGKDSVNRRPGMSSGQADSSLFNATDGVPTTSRGLGRVRNQRSLDWRSKLGPIKDQQTCGSCWTYPATALLEFAIQKTTREKIPLSEQQLLDCTYEGQNYNACQGGWYYTAWDYIIKNGNKLARESDYRYKNADGACYDTYYSNALAGRVKLDSYYKVSASQVVDKMQISPLAVAFFVANSFYAVGTDVFDGCYTYYPSNHAVTLTGYGDGYWEIRNSWGRDWGNGGYARFRRSGTRSICNLLSDVYAIRTSSRSDGNDDRDDGSDDRTDPACADNAQYASSCQGWVDSGYCAAGSQYHEWMSENCMFSCGACPEEEEEDDSTCSDLRTEAECLNWSNYGYCTTGEYVEWMGINCAKTCGVCGEEEREEEREEEEEEEEEEEDSGCRDNSEYANDCPGWRDDGFCQQSSEYYDWMSENCAYSCDTCPEEEDPTERSSGDCEDSHQDCRTWASRGFCTDEDYRDYMTTNCRSSCDTCGEITEEPTPSEETEEMLRHSKVSQSSTMKVKRKKMEANLAVDGDVRTKSQTKCTKKNAWYRYKLTEAGRVNTVEIINGNFDKQREKLNGAEVYAQEVGGLKKKCGRIDVVESSSEASQTYRIDCGGTYASGIEIVQKVKYNKKKCLEIKEIRVYGVPGEESEDDNDEAEDDSDEAEDDNDGCPGGTVRCPDGWCKHIHMC